MGYVVLARKYRPQTFADVIGQEAVAETLKSAVRTDRVAHAYLFAGPRGVGKTSMARILAKALNCPNVKDGEPCDACPVCVDIREGRHFDVDEFDAASKRKVEDAEALIQRVRNPRPYRADTRFSVFIVDEVHMMSDTAFNALLKTLEEPPGHVKFIFATTDPGKLPETVRSRCQRFDFRPLAREDTVRGLAAICRKEGIPAEDAALRLIAARARGGLRDAQMLLDQVIALRAAAEGRGPAALTEAAVRTALGMAPRERILGLLAAVGEGDVAATLKSIAGFYGDGIDASTLVAQALEGLRGLLLAAALGGPAAAAPFLAAREDADDLAKVAGRFPLDRTLHAIAAVAELDRRLQTARDDRVLVDLCFARLARARDLALLPEAIERLQRLEERLAAGGAPGPGLAAAAVVPATPTAPPSAAAVPPSPPPVTARAHSGPPLASAPPPPVAPPPVAPPRPAPPSPAPAPAATAPAASAPAPASAASAPAPARGPLALDDVRDAWARVLRDLAAKRDGASVQLHIHVEGARPVALERGALVIEFPNELDRKQAIEADRNRDRLAQALEAALGGRKVGLAGVVRAGEGKPRKRALTAKTAVEEDQDLKLAVDKLHGQVLDVRRVDGAKDAPAAPARDRDRDGKDEEAAS